MFQSLENHDASFLKRKRQNLTKTGSTAIELENFLSCNGIGGVGDGGGKFLRSISNWNYSDCDFAADWNFFMECIGIVI